MWHLFPLKNKTKKITIILMTLLYIAVTNLGKVGFTGSGRAVEKDTAPWLALSCKTNVNTQHCHEQSLPVKRWGNLRGRITASLRASLAPSSPAMSLHWTLGDSATMAPTTSLKPTLLDQVETYQQAQPFCHHRHP